MRICRSFSSVHSNDEPWWVEMVQLDPPNLNLAETPKVNLSCLNLLAGDKKAVKLQSTELASRLHVLETFHARWTVLVTYMKALES